MKVTNLELEVYLIWSCYFTQLDRPILGFVWYIFNMKLIMAAIFCEDNTSGQTYPGETDQNDLFDRFFFKPIHYSNIHVFFAWNLSNCKQLISTLNLSKHS